MLISALERAWDRSLQLGVHARFKSTHHRVRFECRFDGCRAEQGPEAEPARAAGVPRQRAGVVTGALTGHKSNVQANGHSDGRVNGVDAMEMVESESGSALGSPETDDENSDVEEDVVAATASSMTRVDMLAVSEDGQWLASCNNRGHVNVYNLDVLKVSWVPRCNLCRSQDLTARVYTITAPLHCSSVQASTHRDDLRIRSRTGSRSAGY